VSPSNLPLYIGLNVCHICGNILSIFTDRLLSANCARLGLAEMFQKLNGGFFSFKAIFQVIELFYYAVSSEISLLLIILTISIKIVTKCNLAQGFICVPFFDDSLSSVRRSVTDFTK